MSSLASPELPVFVVPDENLVPVSNHLSTMIPIPASRMFLIKHSLATYRQNNPGSQVFDASQGDGGASLPGAPLRNIPVTCQVVSRR